MSGGNGSSNNWRAPSAAHMQKHSLVPLAEDFEPTQEEELLLGMYETIKTYERQAARLKEEAARQKLAAKDAEFQQKIAPKRKRRKHKVASAGDEANATANNESDLGSNEELSDEDEDQDEEIDAQTIHDRREAKLTALREEVQEAKQPKETEADALRAQHLATATDSAEVSTVPSLKRKKMEPAEQTKSLIANLTASATPPHDFSEKLELKRGVTLYPTDKEQGRWAPPDGVMAPNNGAFLATLEDFDMAKAQDGTGNNTLAIRFNAPLDSKRFSINIAQTGNDDFNSVLFHFNPRQHERGGQLVVNDKQEGIWGQAIQIPLSQCPLLFGQTAVTLVIQINGDGFDVFLDNKHCARWEHRKELPAGSSPLVVQFPSTDDYGSPENWSVYKVWWGNMPIMAKGDLSSVAGVNIYNSMHPRKLFISSLSKIYSEQEVDVRRAELERAFRKYGGDRGVECIVPTNSTYAFVEMESERQADLALSEMAPQYRMNRARRSRHEALQEERAAAEAAKQGKTKTTTDWD